MNISSLVSALEWVGYFFAVIGAVTTILKAVEIWLNYKSLSWNDIDRITKKIIKQIINDRYYPDIIVTIGRGGAIIGSLLSGNLPKTHTFHCNIPVMGTDRMYTWMNGQRYEIENKMIDFKLIKDKAVLLVAGDVITGQTMKHYLEKMNSFGVSNIRTACLVKAVSSIMVPDYVGKEISAGFRMPWMYKDNKYIRDSRESV